MLRHRMTVRFAILFLLLGTTLAWSQRTHRPKSVRDGDAVAESKISPRFSSDPKSSFMLDDHYPKPDGDEEEYVDDEEVKTHKELDEAVGKEESDDVVKNDEYLDHSEKSGTKEFQAGGASFDKHLKDHKADNKEVENVKEHDIGSKFGGEATKEHKLGKHKEKSKGHKLHGFKNVYHKEEYGDHKTFHDEFLDTDHQHNYDDHHEHQEVQGGKFSKGFKHEGKNKKYDKGDEKHEWGKEEFDGHHEGKHEKGKQSSKHRHGSKKHQGQYDANAQRQKNSVHKVKKGVPPPPSPPYIPHGGHHGPHQAQIQPIAPHYNPHHDHVHVQSHNYKPHTHHQQSHHVEYDNGGDKHVSNEDHGSHHHHNHEDHQGGSHHSHGGHHQDDASFSKENDDSDEYDERTARNHKHRSSLDQSEEKSEEKFTPIIKHEPILHRNEPVISRLEPIAHKQPASPRYGIQQYRQPIFQETTSFKPSEPVKQEKYSQPLSERSHNHRIRYGFQPRSHHNHQHHNHQHHNQQHHNHPSHHLQPFPRFSVFNHQHQQAHRRHHHHGGHKNHDHFRSAPSSYQLQPKPDIQASKSEHISSIKPIRGEDQHQRFSQRLY